MSSKPLTLAEKLWRDHLVLKGENGAPDLLYIDLHLIHEVTSPQAFDGLRQAGRDVRRRDLTIATEDHNTPTQDIHLPIVDPTSRAQVRALRDNTREFDIRIHSLGDKKPRHSSRCWPAVGANNAGTDRCLRRFAHINARRLWSTGDGNWNKRS